MIEKKLFDKMPSGEEIYSYTLTTSKNASVSIITFGATITSIKVPDKNGKIDDVVCGFDNINGYISDGAHQGAAIGRYGNRIKGGEFTLDGKKYSLCKNDGNNHLHGGPSGFDRLTWNANAWEIGGTMYAEFSLHSNDGDENYPGNLSVKVLYSFNEENVLTINYKGSSDKKTILNMTNHSYFNLAGYKTLDITDHTLWIDADKTTEADSELIPTGKVLDVAGTPFDFREEKVIGKEIDADNIYLSYGKGYDHNFILNTDCSYVKHLATLKDPKSGRVMKMFTDQPCVQLYTGNCIDESSVPFKDNVPQKKRCGVCLESQHAPDSPNHPEWPSCVLDADKLYDTTTVYKFEA